MIYVSEFVILVLILLPIFAPIFYWYVLKNRTSKIYDVCRKVRRIVAIGVLMGLVFNLIQLPQKENLNFYEALGGILGQSLLAFLLWRQWKKA